MEPLLYLMYRQPFWTCSIWPYLPKGLTILVLEPGSNPGWIWTVSVCITCIINESRLARLNCQPTYGCGLKWVQPGLTEAWPLEHVIVFVNVWEYGGRVDSSRDARTAWHFGLQLMYGISLCMCITCTFFSRVTKSFLSISWLGIRSLRPLICDDTFTSYWHIEK